MGDVRSDILFSNTMQLTNETIDDAFPYRMVSTNHANHANHARIMCTDLSTTVTLQIFGWIRGTRNSKGAKDSKREVDNVRATIAMRFEPIAVEFPERNVYPLPRTF